MAVFSNQAALNFNNKRSVSNIVTGNLVEEVDVTKVAVGKTYFPDDSVAYSVHVVNNTDNALTNLTLVDDMGRYTVDGVAYTPLTYVDNSILFFTDNQLAKTQPVPAIDAATGAMTITGINIPAQGVAEFIYRARTNEFAPMGTGDATDLIRNTVTVQQGITRNALPVTATETIYATDEARLSVTKAIDQENVNVGETITYTFTLQNAGLSEVGDSDNLVLSDTFTPPLTDIQVSVNGKALELDTDYEYDEGTGAFATTTNQITIPAATYARDPDTGVYTVTPGTAILRVTGKMGQP